MHKTYYLFLLAAIALLSIPLKQIDVIEECSKQTIEVELKGEVSEPGVYTLDAQSTVEDLLSLTELNEEADLSSINRTAILNDHDVVVVGKASETVMISINSASIDQLQLLPGIGSAMAQRIVDYRTENGSFQALEELKNVKGIGDKSYEKLKAYICL